MSTSQSRSVRIDAALLRAMSRDATSYALTRPATLLIWGALVAALGLSMVTLFRTTADGQEASALTAWMPALIIAVAALLVFVTSTNVRRSVRSTMPVGSVVSARLDPQTLHAESAAGNSDIAYRSLRSVRVGRDAVMLRLVETGVATVIPRAVLDEGDIQRLRREISG